jgi:tetratricopeptide (TPR) repeat protein
MCGDAARLSRSGFLAHRRAELPPASATDQHARVADQDAEVAGPSPESRIADILAERRRGDYPEVAIEDFGFTITEQVRVGSDARSNYQRALDLLRQDRYIEGIGLLETVIAEVPDATTPYVDLGIAYRGAGNFERAEEVLGIAAALNPDNPVVHNELGILFRQTGRFAQAQQSYERALTVFADFHYARRNLAVLCDLYLANLDCALQHYSVYLESVGDDPEVEIWIADLENRLASQGGN